MKIIRGKSRNELYAKLEHALRENGTPLRGEFIRDGSLHFVEVDEDALVQDGSDAWYWISRGTNRALCGCFHDEAKWMAYSCKFFSMKQLAIFTMQYSAAKAYSEQRRAACEYWMQWNESGPDEVKAF